MKKFFPLCLLLIVAIVWTVSIAGDADFLTKSNQPGPAKKAPVIQKEKTVAQTEKVTRVAPVYGDINADQREEAIARARTSKSAGEPNSATIVPSDQGAILSKPGMKGIKADGVISPDERAEYEALIARAQPVPPLPEPFNIVSESEPNDTCTTADPIACGDTVWCADLTTGADSMDWYTFTLTDDQQVTIETHPTGTDCQVSSTTDTRLFLFESDCTTLIAANDDIDFANDNYFSRIVINLTPGTYAVLTDDYWDDGSYHMSLLCNPIVPVWYCADDPPLYILPTGKSGGGNMDIEPNDTCTTAQPVLCEYAYCGDLTNLNSDWYYIDLPADTTYALHVRVFANDTPNQYAYGGGLDPWVGLYKADCTTLVTQNEDYGGTFPDAENFDSQIDPNPLAGNCFSPGERVYIEVRDNWNQGGPYLLIINCVVCEKPTGACCVNEECVATNLEVECDALGGEWWIGEDCAAFVRCAPIGNCDNAVYNNGVPVDQYGSPASQCIYDFALPAGTADDVTLTEDAQISRIITWTSHWNGNVGGPARYDGINVTFYLDDINSPGQPGGYPAGDCSHIQTVPGGVYSTQFVPMGMVNWEQDLSMTCTTDRWMLEIFLPVPVDLLASTLYWVEIQPIMAFGSGGQSAIVLSDQNIGADAIQWFDTGPWASIAGNSATCDPFTPGIYRNIAFCLIAPGGCDYAVGDVNGSGNYNGLDITYGVNFFKSIGPDPQCDPNCPPCPDWFYCGDVNNSCNYNGLDITYGVNYLKGIGPDPVPCDACPPVGGIAGDISEPETPSAIKTKSVLKKNSGSK